MTSEHDIDYEALAQEAMRGVVRAVLQRVQKTGLPGEHHFYIAFNTRHPNVAISKRLKEKYGKAKERKTNNSITKRLLPTGATRNDVTKPENAAASNNVTNEVATTASPAAAVLIS